MTEPLAPAVALFEYGSIAEGIRAGDAMVKRAPLEALHAGTVQPGRYLIVVGGAVAAVEEAWAASREAQLAPPDDAVFLPDIERRIIDRLCGAEAETQAVEALGILETRRAPAALEAADAGLKGAAVELLGLRLSDGLGGKAYILFAGAQADVEAALDLGAARIGEAAILAQEIIPRLHPEMLQNLMGEPRFTRRLRDLRR